MRWSKRHGLSFTINKKWSNDFRLWVGESTTRYPNLMKTNDPWLLTPHVVERGAYILFWWHILWQLGKAFNKQYKFSHLSLIWSLALDIPVESPLWEIAKVPLNKEKRFLGALKDTSLFWVSGVELPLIFYTKNKKKLIQNTWLNCSVLIDWGKRNTSLINWILCGFGS